MTNKFEKIAKRLKLYSPEKIILFGSYAWGKPTKDSDIDILVVKKTKKNPYRRIPEARSYLHNIEAAIDVLVMTPKEIEQRLELDDFFIKNIVNKGRILYESKK